MKVVKFGKTFHYTFALNKWLEYGHNLNKYNKSKIIYRRRKSYLVNYQTKETEYKIHL